MDYISPKDVAASMLNVAINKTKLSNKDILIRAALAGALLGVSVILAATATTQLGSSVLGAIIFPVGFVMITLLTLELATGNFCLVPLAWFERKITGSLVFKNLGVVYIGNLIGSLIIALLFWISSPFFNGPVADGSVEKLIISIAEKKTIAYAAKGNWGFIVAFVKGILCNWLVCLGIVMGLTSSSTIGKIVAAGIPIFIFFALGYEHSIVNMFVIPAGIFLGANVTMSDWWLYNQIIVTLGNFVGGLLFTGMAIYFTYRPKTSSM